jgi:DNA-binding transcriptional LysR family regulator
VVFHVSDVVTPALHLPELRDRTLDLAVLRTRWPLPTHVDDLDVEELFDDETVIIAGVDSRWARMRKIELADLAEAKWILPPADTTNSIVVMEAFRARGLEPPAISFVTFSVTLRTSLLATGRYVSVLPRSMMSLYARRMALKVLPVRLAVRKWPVIIATLKNRTLALSRRCSLSTCGMASKRSMLRYQLVESDECHCVSKRRVCGLAGSGARCLLGKKGEHRWLPVTLARGGEYRNSPKQIRQ